MRKFYFSLLLLCSITFTWAQEFISSNLPIVIITTDEDPNTGNPIPIVDDPKTTASMKVIYRTDGSRNFVSDQDNPDFIDYDGKIGIEFRGSTSQELPKKPYGFETREEDGSNNNVELLSLPKENDWVLNSLAFDKSLLRDYMTYDLAREIGDYTSRGRYCEVVVNGDYKGLYILGEKIKVDSNRMNIEKLDPEDVNFPKITGGYYIKADKTTGGDPVAWQYRNRINDDVKFILENPDPEVVTSEQIAFIKSVFDDLSTTTSEQNESIVDGYPSIIDLPSFVDFMLLNELASNTDAYQFSTYFHKDRGCKLRAGPIWDFNFSYGNDFQNLGRSRTDVWQFDNGDNVGADFWKDLYDSPTFKCYLSKRWSELTIAGGPLEYQVFEDRIDNLVILLSEAKERENDRWGTLSEYNTEINNIKLWLQDRYTWLNNRLGDTSGCDFPELADLVICEINYHPGDSGDIDNDDLEFVALTNNTNATVNLTGKYFRALGISYQFANNASIEPNQKIYLANHADIFESSYGFPAFGEYTRDLSNKSQRIQLTDAFGNTVDNVKYFDKGPWPEEADGDGFYLVLNDLDSDNDLAVNWSIVKQSILGLENTSNNVIQTSVYPNPVKDFMTVKNDQSTIEKLTLYDLQGKQILSVSNNSNQAELNLEGLAKSMYVLRIAFDNG